MEDFENSKASKINSIPDFSQSVGQIDKCSSKITPPCTNCSSKVKRKKGEGSGHIYYRTVTRNGRKYQQAYYQWRENGQQKTKYIPKNLLPQIIEAEYQKYTVWQILSILQGGLKKCSSNCSSTFSQENVLANDESVETIDKCSSKISSPPSKRKKRCSGYGGGYVEYREVKRNHKVYGQYWYHYEFWREGNVVVKKSRYIPKQLVQKVTRMNDEKVAVRRILEVLKVKS